MPNTFDSPLPYYPITEAIQMLEQQVPLPARQKVNLELKVLCPGPDDGDCGAIPTTTPLEIPDVSTLIICPMGCSLHLTETGRGHNNNGRAWILRLTEAQIVTSDYYELIDHAISEIIHSVPTKAIILCGTCIDALLGTDFESTIASLGRKYSIRITSQIMGPILKGTPRNGKYHMYTSIYNLLKESPISSEKAVNVLGPLHDPSPNSELHELLQQVGISHLYYMGDFHSIEECDIMTRSVLNIVVYESALTAAKEMKSKWGIPYIYLRPSYDPHVIHENYLQLGKALNKTIDDTPYYSKSLQLLDNIRTLAHNKTCAVGERNIFPTLDVATDVLALGFQLKYIFARNISVSDLPKLKKIASTSQDTILLFDTHPSLINLVENPFPYDISFGVPLLFIKNAPNTLDAPIHFPSIDYSTTIVLLEKLESLLLSGKYNADTVKTHVHKKHWITYDERTKNNE